MIQKTTAEYKALLGFQRRAATLSDLIAEYRGEPNMLGRCLKLVRYERNKVRKGKAPICAEDLREVVWLYDEMIDIAYTLQKTSDAALYSRASAKLMTLQERINNERRSLEVRAGGNVIADKAAEAVEKVKEGVLHICNGIENASQKVKKTFLGENSE